MRRALFTTLTAVLLLLGPAPVSATILAEDEKTTVQLIGEDGNGNVTIFLKQTTTNTNDLVFIMDLAVNSNYDYAGCIEAASVFRDRSRSEGFCARDLWVAILFPDDRLYFLVLEPGLTLSAQFAGFRAYLPYISPVFPYLTLGALTLNPPLDIKPYPSRGHLFGITQAVINGLPPGEYSIFAGYTTLKLHTENIEDLFAALVSNVAQYTILIEEPTVPCGQIQVAGGDTPDFRLIDLGNIGGTFQFDYQTFSQEDRMIVRYEGNTLFDTQCVGTGTTKSVLLTYHGTSTKVSVQVIPNCNGGLGTAWNYTVYCPMSSFP